MKKILSLAALCAALLLAALPAAPARADVSVSFSFFHDSLSPYGSWVTVGSYGRCWYPGRIGAGWQPYTVGRWVYTDYGWTWMSADPWGDVTYRYGTWVSTPAYGWVWVPGFVWAPAWVTWSYTNDYIGWAPIPPSFSLTYSGYFGAPVVVSRSAYCFVPARRFVGVNAATVRVSAQQNAYILQRSQNVTRYAVSGGVVRNSGPEPERIERVARTQVRRVSSSDAGLRPAPVQASRDIGRRLPVVAPASAKVVPASSRRVENDRSVEVDRRAPQTRAPQTREKASKSRDAVPEERSRSVAPAPSRQKQAPRVEPAPRPQSRESEARVSKPKSSKPAGVESRSNANASVQSSRREGTRSVRAPAPRAASVEKRSQGSAEKAKRPAPQEKQPRKPSRSKSTTRKPADD